MTEGLSGSFSVEKWLFEGEGVPAGGTRFAGVNELGKGLLISALFRRTDQPLVAVFNTKGEARNAIDNFSFFAGKEGQGRIHYLPATEFDYYRGLLPNPEIQAERNVGLFHALNDSARRVFVTTVGALLQKGFPPTEYLRATRVLKPNDEWDRDALLQGLVESGYQRQPAAYDPGVFSVRGGVIDIFSPLYSNPLRVEFFGDLIEEIRCFDPKSQRSLEPLKEAYVVPVGQSLVPHGEEFAKAAIRVKERLDNLGIPKSDRDEMLEKIEEGSVPSELAFLFPLLSNGSSPLMDYFPANTLFLFDGQEKTIELANDTEIPRYEKNLELFEKEPFPVAQREELFLSKKEFEAVVRRPENLFFEDFVEGDAFPTGTLQCEPLSLEAERSSAVNKSGSHPMLESFARRFRAWMDEGYRIQIVSHTRTHADRIFMLFETYDIKSTVQPEGTPGFPGCLKTEFSALNLWQGVVTQSGTFRDLKLVILSEEEIFGHKKRAAKSGSWSSASDSSKLLSAFRDLKLEDFVVHKDHGIGKYLGLKSMNFLGVPNDYVLLEYKDGDKLYVPVYRLNVLQKYSSAEGTHPVLDKLGGDRWVKAKHKAERAVAELATQLLDIQAKRKLLPAFACSEPSQDYTEFEMKFPFDETPDQLKAIEDVNADLGESHPMDRLLCGDVGYGKTEVALRAAFRCALDSRQVAILVPTTVLAFQHFETFKARLKETAIRVEMVSRLRSTAEIREILERLKDGKVDVIIGTHRLLSSDVIFKNLGLVVIDEEHRFGVTHKERLKKLCETVHVLAMTATPIPRTLNMAMTGIKDISIITTPPPDRLSVRTFVCRRAEEVIAEAITNELTRDGQVFFVHNRIETIAEVSAELKRLLPKLKFEVVHGQMSPDMLEQKMLAFYRGDFQLLLTTAIIESGLDVPRANTILIDRADHFGLAQLYQLRGRVGRSERRAYCYLLVPPQGEMTEDGKQRLQVIQRYTDLGAGFNVASHDLEIRGAGDLLGKDQSGQMTAVGVDLYFELLEESILALKGQKKLTEIEPEINLKVAAYFPADYLPDISERIAIYRKLSSVDSDERISEVEQEIRDRFGTLPTEVLNLLGLMRMKLYLKRLHVVRMSAGPKRTSLQFAATTPASPEKLVKLVQSNPKRYSMTPDQKLVFAAEETDWHVLLREVQRLSEILGVG